MVKFVATLTSRCNQPRIFENIEVLRDCLATRGHLMLGRQARADFKKRLSVPCGQLIENRSPSRVCQGLEDIPQPDHDRQVVTCMSTVINPRADQEKLRSFAQIAGIGALSWQKVTGAPCSRPATSYGTVRCAMSVGDVHIHATSAGW
jgi:hypothetical protein